LDWFYACRDHSRRVLGGLCDCTKFGGNRCRIFDSMQILIFSTLSLKMPIPKKPQHVFFHVFAQTTHVVAAPHGFACVGIPATRVYIPTFIEIRLRVSEPQGVKIWPFPLLWLVAFTTAYTTVQAVKTTQSTKTVDEKA